MVQILPEPNLIFLFSVPRSGSTILAHCLANTGQIYSESEPWLMLAIEQFGKINLRSEYGSWHVAKGVTDFLGPDRSTVLSEIARLIYARRLANGYDIFLDKTPRYFWILNFISELFPGSKKIFLSRDPLDIAASFKSSWNLRISETMIAENSETSLFDLFHGFDILQRHFNQPDSRTRIAIRYEDFVKDARSCVRRIFDQFDLEARAVDWPDVDTVRLDRLAPDRFGDQKIRQTRAVHHNSVGSWRRVLEQDEAELVAAYTGLCPPDLPTAASEKARERARMMRLKLHALLSSRRLQQELALSVCSSAPALEPRIRDAYASLTDAWLCGRPGARRQENPGLKQAGKPVSERLLPAAWPCESAGAKLRAQPGCKNRIWDRSGMLRKLKRAVGTIMTNLPIAF